jgi:DNA-binding protein HU-beta
MTRNELLTALRDRLRSGAEGEGLAALQKREIAALLDLAFAEIGAAIHADGRFSYPGFGTFTLRALGERHGRNPRTGEAIVIAPSQRIAFSPAERLRRGEPGVGAAAEELGSAEEDRADEA